MAKANEGNYKESGHEAKCGGKFVRFLAWIRTARAKDEMENSNNVYRKWTAASYFLVISIELYRLDGADSQF